MKKILGLLQMISLFSIILYFPVACTQNKQFEKVGIYNNQMEQVTTKVTLNQDTYEDILTNDKAGVPCFKTLLIENMNQFATKNHLTLNYATDYKFSIEDIDNPYIVIKKFGIITIDVQASAYSNKIVGKFKTEVNLVNQPSSIDGVGNKIGNQTYNDVELNQTTFQDVIKFYLNKIQGQIQIVNSQAKAFVDYAINFQGYKLQDKITKADLGVQIININAIGDKPNPLLEGSTSFNVDLSVKK